MNEEINFYKDKIIDGKQELYEYANVNKILNKYKNELKNNE